MFVLGEYIEPNTIIGHLMEQQQLQETIFP
jgi:hypothetical protein